MELTKEQIQQLFTFVRSKYVRYYDVQLELVDHLASAIEEEMTGKKNLKFDQALNRVYSRFPVTGFHEFLKEKTKNLNKYWRRRFWAYMKKYFTLPKVILTILLTFLLYTSSNIQFEIFGLEMSLLWMTFLGIGILGLYIIIQYYPINPSKTHLLSKLIFIQQLTYYIIGPVYFLGYVWPQLIVNQVDVNAIYFNILLSIGGAFTLIALTGALTDFRLWMEEEIEERYKDLQVAAN